ncbi:UDP-glucuronic acid decarboxylase family protein [Bosea sp. RCC_152_1]|uniref:UDP-glucuronic acid decarboxylase family protein n=1 Tax=Bosea sp. RCC_152_1 TaxID=3239228 RepID=UPI003523F6D1
MVRRVSPVTLVAGGAGFLGNHLCERLLGEGHRVICLDNLQTGSLENLRRFERESRFRFIEADVCELPARLRADYVYNLACPASPPLYQADPVHTMMTSVVGTRNLLEVARRSGGRMLQASTSEVYGDPEEHPQRESYRGSVNPIGIRACYDEGKRAGEALCFDYRRTYATDVRVARIFNTYGPRMRPDDGRIVSNLIVQALSGAPLTIYGDGEQTRSFCYVSDLIEGLCRLMMVDPNPEVPVNLGNPDEYTINALADLVLDLTGSASRPERRPLPADDPQCRRPDISRAYDVLGWAPRTGVVEGLAATIAWFDASSAIKRPVAPAWPAAVGLKSAAAGGAG